MKAMRGRVIAGMVVVAFTVFAILAVLSGRTVAQSPFGDANAEPAPFNPQMAALMSMLIQPRHTKLGLAGESGKLAARGLHAQGTPAGLCRRLEGGSSLQGLAGAGPGRRCRDAAPHAPRFRDQARLSAPIR